MPNRILREGILTSERIEKLNWAEEVFYRRLMSVVDDFGRYYARPSLLLAACYPLLLKKVSDSDIEKWLSACENAALVRVYPAQDGKRYLQLVDFKQQVRASASRFPHPPDACAADAMQAHDMGAASAHLGVSVFGGVVEDGGDTRASAGPPRRAKSKKTQIPDDFGISDRVKAWADEKGYGNLDAHLDAFKRKAIAKAYTYVDWDAAFMEAIREDWAKLRGRAPNGAAPPPESKPASGPDPTLLKIAQDQKNAVPPSPEIRERMRALRRAA